MLDYKTSKVYKIECTTTGKAYIGSTTEHGLIMFGTIHTEEKVTRKLEPTVRS